MENRVPSNLYERGGRLDPKKEFLGMDAKVLLEPLLRK